MTKLHRRLQKLEAVLLTPEFRAVMKHSEPKTLASASIRGVRYAKPKSLHCFAPAPLFSPSLIDAGDRMPGPYGDDCRHQRLENPVNHVLIMSLTRDECYRPNGSFARHGEF